MTEVTITQKIPAFQKGLSLVAGCTLTIYSLAFALNKALLPAFDTPFFIALSGICIGICTVLAFTFWLPKPIFSVNSESIIPHLPNQRNLKEIVWDDVCEINVGLYFLSIKTVGGKSPINIDLSEMRHTDLKALKTCIIEICEGRKIPYQSA